MSNSLIHKEKRRLRAKIKAKESNIKRPKRQSIEGRKLAKIGG